MKRDLKTWPLLILLVGLSSLVAWLTLSPQHDLEPQFSACNENVREIGAAVSLYSADHRGKLPKALAEIVPHYLPALPKCPAAHADTYSDSYVVTTLGPGESLTRTAVEAPTGTTVFKVFCQGQNHPGHPPNHPEYIGQ